MNPWVSPLRRQTERAVRQDSCSKLHIVFKEGDDIRVPGVVVSFKTGRRWAVHPVSFLVPRLFVLRIWSVAIQTRTVHSHRMFEDDWYWTLGVSRVQQAQKKESWNYSCSARSDGWTLEYEDGMLQQLCRLRFLEFNWTAWVQESTLDRTWIQKLVESSQMVPVMSILSLKMNSKFSLHRTQQCKRMELHHQQMWQNQLQTRQRSAKPRRSPCP